MPDFVLKQHDRLPSIQAIFTSGGQAVDLTTATGVQFIMRPLQGGPVKVASPAVIVNAAGGVVRYDWLAADTDTAGSYQAEWQVTWADGKPQTFPTQSYHTVDVLADLDGA